MDGFDPDFLPADPAAIAKARADALARRRTAPLDPNSPEAQYAPEAENLGALRFLNAVPFGTQLAAGAKALGERVRGETDHVRRRADQGARAVSVARGVRGRSPRRSHGKGRKAPVTPATSTDSGCRITWETAC